MIGGDAHQLVHIDHADAFAAAGITFGDVGRPLDNVVGWRLNAFGQGGGFIAAPDSLIGTPDLKPGMGIIGAEDGISGAAPKMSMGDIADAAHAAGHRLPGNNQGLKVVFFHHGLQFLNPPRHISFKRFVRQHNFSAPYNSN